MFALRFAGGRWSAWYLVLLPLGTLEYLLAEYPDWALLAWGTPLLWLVFYRHTRPLMAYAVGLLGLTLLHSTQHTVNILTGPAFHLINLLFAATYLLPFLVSQVLAPRVPPASRWLFPPWPQLVWNIAWHWGLMVPGARWAIRRVTCTCCN